MQTKSKKLIWLLACAFLLAAFVLVLDFYSPKAASELKNDAVLSFSADPGFYDTAFSLQILCDYPDYKIYYTLDGSLPDENSLEYRGSVEISDASNEENRYSMREDVSAGFIDNLEELSDSADPGFKAPDYKIDKCTVVRAVAVDAQGNSSECLCGSFFVGFQDKEAYEGADVVSIVTDPSNLFDYDTGIYVLGRYYDIFKKNSLIFGRKDNWMWWDANYRQQGMDWERGADICSWDASRIMKLDNSCGIRVHGNISRARLPRSLAVYAYDTDGQTVSFAGDVFDNGYNPEKLILYGQEPGRRLKEYVISEAVKNLDIATLNYRPCALFLNGEYWGNYSLGEKYDAAYVSQYYGVDPENVYLVKDNDSVEGGSNAYREYRKMYSWISSHDMTVQQNYERALEYFDLESYIDFFAVKIYINDTDWPGKNYACWRSIECEDGEYADCLWRWMLVDINHGNVANSDFSQYDMIERAMKKDSMFASLMQNEVFRKKFYVKLEALSENEFSYSNITALVQEYNELTQNSVTNEIRRFYGENSSELLDYNNAVSSVNMFMIMRAEYIKEQCDSDYLPFEKNRILDFRYVRLEGQIVIVGVGVIVLFAAALLIIDIKRNCGRRTCR